MKISDNFHMSEFAVSASFPQLVTPVPLRFYASVVALVKNVLQPICDATGWHDEITSGYRSATLNRSIGGSKTSQHMRGEAADNKFFTVWNRKRAYIAPLEVARKVLELNLPFDQMIVYNGFTHISHSLSRNRKQFFYDRKYRGLRL